MEEKVKTLKLFMIGCFLLVLLTSCAAAIPEPTATNVPPTATPEPTSCEEVEGVCLEFSFDGESCTYEGPSDLKPGPVTLIFHNESDGWAETILMRSVGDKTLQDFLDFYGEEPSTQAPPSWSFTIPGSWEKINAGEFHFWEGDLEPGIHVFVCVKAVAWPDVSTVWIGKTWTIGK